MSNSLPIIVTNSIMNAVLGKDSAVSWQISDSHDHTHISMTILVELCSYHVLHPLEI
jgi:hypothetical protein